MEMRLCVELGCLAATTARHPKFASKELYGPLLRDDFEGLRLSAQPRRGSRAKVLSIDVEMVDVEMVDEDSRGRRRQLPVSAAVVRGDTGEVVYSSFLAPCDDWEARDDDLDWKTDIHGISATTLREASNRGELGTIRDVQRVIEAEWDDLTFLCGHRLSGDLKVLQIGGTALARRVVDTMLLRWNRGAPSLKSLVAGTGNKKNLLPGRDHDATADAQKAAAVLDDDLDALLASLAEPAARGGGKGCAASSSQSTVTVMIPEPHVGRLIGKAGATLHAIKARCADVTLDLAAAPSSSLGQHPQQNSAAAPPPADENNNNNDATSHKKKGATSSLRRRLDLRGESAEKLLECLAAIEAAVPTIARAIGDARRSLEQAHSS